MAEHRHVLVVSASSAARNTAVAPMCPHRFSDLATALRCTDQGFSTVGQANVKGTYPFWNPHGILCIKLTSSVNAISPTTVVVV